MKNIVSVALAGGFVVFGLVACNLAPSTPQSSDGSDDSQAADTDGKDTTKKDTTTKKTPSSNTSSSSSGATNPSGADAGASTSSSGSVGDDDDDPALCNTSNGSCRTSAVCNEYYGGDAATQKKTCDALKGTWSDDPCDTTDTVGGCKQITKAQNFCGGAISWMFAPMTADSLGGACPSPGVVIQPGDEN